MKFLCDRCQTRYSIGDDRVRGKILKIRCKSCGNVITVREGMAVELEAPPPAAAAAANRGASKEPPSVAAAGRGGGASKEPSSVAAADRGGGASKEPPSPSAPAVSRPGGARDAAGGARDAAGGARDTAGAARSPAAPASAPAGAAQARGGAPADPVGAGGGRGGQVDTARGFGGGSGRSGAGAQHESVNALSAAFATAMAQPPPAALEEEWYVSIDGDQAGPYSLADAQRWVGRQPYDAELHCWSEGFDDWLSVDKVSHFRGLRKRPPAAAAAAPPPLLPRAGAQPRPALDPRSPPEDTPKPLFAATMASLERGAPSAPVTGLGLPPPAAPPSRATPPLGTPLAPRTPQAGRAVNGAPGDARGAVRSPVGDPFDTGESSDAATQLEAMPFEDAPVEPRRSPLAAGKPDAAAGKPDAAAGKASASAGKPAAAGAAALRASDPPLAAPQPSPPSPGAAAAATAPANADFGGDDDLHIGEVSRVVNLADIARGAPDRSAVRRTGALPVTGRTTGATSAEGDPARTMAPVVRAHRRGLIALLVVAIALVVGVIGAVILFVTTDDDSTGNSLGAVHDIDTSRPEDPITHRPIGSAAPQPAPVTPRPSQHVRPAPGGGSSQVAEAPGPTGGLASDEIEDAARKHQEMTQRCYMRSQRGADAILIGDVKKIAVTLTIDRDGNVSELQLSDHAGDNLGKCLAGAIKAWKFRPSAGGTYRFSLNFVRG